MHELPYSAVITIPANTVLVFAAEHWVGLSLEDAGVVKAAEQSAPFGYL
jgi:hypothetical protein